MATDVPTTSFAERHDPCKAREIIDASVSFRGRQGNLFSEDDYEKTTDTDQGLGIGDGSAWPDLTFNKPEFGPGPDLHRRR